MTFYAAVAVKDSLSLNSLVRYTDNCMQWVNVAMAACSKAWSVWCTRACACPTRRRRPTIATAHPQPSPSSHPAGGRLQVGPVAMRSAVDREHQAPCRLPPVRPALLQASIFPPRPPWAAPPRMTSATVSTIHHSTTSRPTAGIQ